METFATISGLVIALLAVAKKAGISTRYLPILGVAIGIALGFVLEGFSATSALSGLIASLAAQGLYSGTKTTVKK